MCLLPIAPLPAAGDGLGRNLKVPLFLITVFDRGLSRCTTSSGSVTRSSTPTSASPSPSSALTATCPSPAGYRGRVFRNSARANYSFGKNCLGDNKLYARQTTLFHNKPDDTPCMTKEPTKKQTKIDHNSCRRS